MNLQQQLIRDEGKRNKPYRDSVGKLTIGVGRNLDDEGVSDDEVNLMLANDIASHQADLYRALPWVQNIDLVRQGALLNMCFNMGIGGLLQFKNTLSYIQAGNYSAAATEMLKSHWAQEVGARAQRLSTQIETGEWQ